LKANKLRPCKNLDSKPGRHVGTPHCLLGRQWEEENMGEGVQQKEMRWSIDQIKKVGMPEVAGEVRGRRREKVAVECRPPPAGVEVDVAPHFTPALLSEPLEILTGRSNGQSLRLMLRIRSSAKASSTLLHDAFKARVPVDIFHKGRDDISIPF
jgi:hypothetical protein